MLRNSLTNTSNMEKTRPQYTAEDKALEKFADLMIEKLQAIDKDWKKPWFTQGIGSLPKNLSGREYNGMNSLMLMMQAEKMDYQIPVWCTFDRVVSLNYTLDKQGARTQIKDKDGNPLPHVCVNKGEKSFPVFITTFTCINIETHEKVRYDEYKHMDDDERAKHKVFPKLQVYYVFNIEQTNIKDARPDLYAKLQGELPKPNTNCEDFTFAALDSMIADGKWICPIMPTYGDDAYYSISKKVIVVPKKDQFWCGESFYSNLLHEMAHSTGAEDYLNKLKPAAFGSSEYAKEELVAELTAALVSQRYGMSKVLKNDSAAYLKCWLQTLKQDPSFIKTVLQDVKKASQMIVSRIEEVNN